MDWPISWNDVKEALDNAGGNKFDIVIRSTAIINSEDMTQYSIDPIEWTTLCNKIQSGKNVTGAILFDFMYGSNRTVQTNVASCVSCGKVGNLPDANITLYFDSYQITARQGHVTGVDFLE